MFRRRRDEGGDHRWSQIVRNWQEVVTRGTVPTPPRTLFASFVSRAVYASISLLRIDFEIDPGKYPIPSPRPIQYLRQCAEKNIHAALLVHRCRSFGQRTNPDSRFISLTMYRISNPIFYPVERGIRSLWFFHVFVRLLSPILLFDREEKEKEKGNSTRNWSRSLRTWIIENAFTLGGKKNRKSIEKSQSSCHAFILVGKIGKKESKIRIRFFFASRWKER